MTLSRVTGLGALVVAACVMLSACGSSEKLGPPPKAIPARPWVCEACGHTFRAPHALGVAKCASCNKPAAIRSIEYTCGQCGKHFEAYRFLDCAGMEAPKGPEGKPLKPGAYFKHKGGAWVPDEEMLDGFKCPHCGNADRGKMRLRAAAAS
ncbi:MAG: hypothetical protein ISS72_02895 [Candidatus Brocadiae bacterium]|nr:hypothetical protein [Candidatus Brocadiia bacterium]